MLLRTGVDLIEIDRIAEVIHRHGARYLDRVYTEAELEQSRNDPETLAGRFAAKEAVSKALSTGWAGEFRWKDVEVMNDPSGQPHIAFSGKLGVTLTGASVFVSLSHSDSHVVAMVLIEEREPCE